MIDYITPAMRLMRTEQRRNCQTLEEANAYLDQRRISVLRHGYTPTSKDETDVAATWANACPEWVASDRDTPMFLRRQAA